MTQNNYPLDGQKREFTKVYYYKLSVNMHVLNTVTVITLKLILIIPKCNVISLHDFAFNSLMLP